MRKNLILFLLGILLTINTFAQDTSNVNRSCVWVELGGGFYRNTNFFRLGSAVWLNYSHDNILYKFRYESINEAMPMGARPIEYSKNYALMIGKLKGNDYMQVSATLGLGVLTGIYRGDFLYSNGSIFSTDYYEEKKINSLSIPFELDCTLKPLPVLAFGASITGDLNPKQSTIGLLIKVGIGLYPNKQNLDR